MSIEAVATVLHHSQATPTAKLVLTAIAWHEGENPALGAWPSQETLGHYANLSARQIRRALDQLLEIGEIDIIKNGGPRTGPKPAPNLYIVLLECPENCDRTLSHRVEVINGSGIGQNRQHNRTKLAKSITKNDLLINNKQTRINNNPLRAIGA